MSEQNPTPQAENTPVAEPEDYGVREFMVGDKPTTLRFTAAARFRLFKDLNPQEIQAYVTSEPFKLHSAGLLLLGKEALTVSVDEVLDRLDDLGLMEHELHAIYQWVLKRTINFMLKEAEVAAQILKQAIPQVTELSNTLNTLQG